MDKQKIPAQPFQIEVPQAVLDDLQERLDRTRWPDEVSGADWDYGTNLAYMKKLADYWQHRYDWRGHEAALNELAHFKAEIDGKSIHFIHEPGKGPDPTPVIITHGWPGSFYELIKIIPLLTDPAGHGGDPAHVFDVIVPSIPGFGFSDPPHERGWTLEDTADVWATLMTNMLGYERFAASGTDWGSGITRLLARKYPGRIVGIYLSNVSFPDFTPEPSHLSEAEGQHLQVQQGWMWSEGGYAMIQGTRPQTLAYGLNDSPVGLAAWLVDKFRSLSDCSGDIERRFSKDELLTNVMIYWVSETANSAARIYYEPYFKMPPLEPGERIEAPAGIGLFGGAPPRKWVERTLHVKRWTPMPRGGHFAAMEEPELLASDMRAFFHELRASR